MSLIRLENVSLARQGKTLLSGLNWTVEKGQTWAILGLNGAGKSTLLRLLTAEFFPSEGKAEILGYTFGNGDITGLRQHIGIVSSFITERLPQHMTAEKIVLTGKYKSSILYKAYGDKELQEAKDMLTSLGAGDLICRKYRGLSQGEKQICLIARSLMKIPTSSSLTKQLLAWICLPAKSSYVRLTVSPRFLTHHWSFTSPTMLKKSLKKWTTSSYSVKEKSWHKDQKMISSHRKF